MPLDLTPSSAENPSLAETPLHTLPVTGTRFPTAQNGDLFQTITGSLRAENGTNYTWSVKAFKRWKKRFKSVFTEQYGQPLSEIVPDSEQRERLYKTLLGMQGFDVFRNGHTEGQVRIESTLLQTCQNVAALVEGKIDRERAA